HHLDAAFGGPPGLPVPAAGVEADVVDAAGTREQLEARGGRVAEFDLGEQPAGGRGRPAGAGRVMGDG
ncbi:hypothetical protein, partial [Candidatus Frankia alpina]|uniref:hypothetical protein n=1 Tax=Candidatus Frankia alpina TaxID=2699483 RepID=UPI001A9A255E